MSVYSGYRPKSPTTVRSSWEAYIPAPLDLVYESPTPVMSSGRCAITALPTPSRRRPTSAVRRIVLDGKTPAEFRPQQPLCTDMAHGLIVAPLAVCYLREVKPAIHNVELHGFTTTKNLLFPTLYFGVVFCSNHSVYQDLYFRFYFLHLWARKSNLIRAVSQHSFLGKAAGCLGGTSPFMKKLAYAYFPEEDFFAMAEGLVADFFQTKFVDPMITPRSRLFSVWNTISHLYMAVADPKLRKQLESLAVDVTAGYLSAAVTARFERICEACKKNK